MHIKGRAGSGAKRPGLSVGRTQEHVGEHGRIETGWPSRVRHGVASMSPIPYSAPSCYPAKVPTITVAQPYQPKTAPW
ncbi:hypothetical protein MBT84_39660 [Streptomyces sp. MBT84]|nr:hypothetical protein [Streptomyces sp. MBT84]